MTAQAILTLTMNPAVDVCMTIDRLVPSHKMRCGAAHRDAGGGGINAARVIRRLGGNPGALFPAGGPIGQLLERLIAAENLAYTAIPIANDTREDFTVDEAATGAQYRFVLPGPELTPQELSLCRHTLAARLSESNYLIASGSLPPSVPVDFYAQVAAMAAASGVKFVVDSSGPGLKAALGSGVYLIKPSLREFRELIGQPLPDEGAWLEAARGLIAARRVELVALSLGEDGALLVGSDFALRATAPKVTPVSTVGAGDSFLGALVWAIADGRQPKEALQTAVAAGTAALLSAGTDLCHMADIDRLFAEVQVTQI